MKISEEELVKTIDKIVTRLACKFRFGYHDIEDIKQQARLYCLEALPRYDEKRPLDNFLYSHARNRLINFKRDNLTRYDKPCLGCPFYDPHCDKSISKCAEFSDKTECKEWKKWTTTNTRKKNIMEGIELQDNSESLLREEKEQFEDSELYKLIREHLDVMLLGDFLRMISGGVHISGQRRRKVQEAIVKILSDFHYTEELKEINTGIFSNKKHGRKQEEDEHLNAKNTD